MPGKQGTTRERLPAAWLRAPSSEQTHLRAAGAAVARPAHAVAPAPGSSFLFDFARTSVDKNVTDVARQGLAGSGTALPYQSTLQPLFGGHDLSGIQAVIGGRAAVASRSLGATAYAQGERVGFVRAPDLFATAHEAAHVVQQRSGRVGVGYHGHPGDEFERQADSVADLVVRGQSAASVLNQNARGESTSRSPGSVGSSVQFKLAAGQDLEDIPEDDPYWQKLLESKGGRNIDLAFDALGMRADLLAVAEFEKGSAAGKKPAELASITGGHVLATRTLFEVELGQVIMDNLSLFATPVRKVTSWIVSYLSALAQQLAGRSGELESMPVDRSLSEQSLMGSIDRAIEINKLKEMKALVEKLIGKVSAAKTLMDLREAHYSFADKLFTSKDEVTRGMRSAVINQLSGDHAVDTEQVRGNVKLAEGSPTSAFDRRGRSGASLFAPEPAKSPESGGSKWNVFFYEPEKQKPNPISGKLESPARFKRDANHKAQDPNLFAWQQLTRYMMPITAGVSGTMADMIALGKTAGLSDVELWEYAMPQMGAMLAERHHSFHEIAMVMRVNIKGVSYVPGSYLGPIHPKIKQLPAYRRLQAKYPYILI